MDRINEIRERASKATKGEWKVVVKGNTVESQAIVTDSGINVCSGISPKRNDADFIAHSKSDIEYLLSEIDRLTSLLAEQQADKDATDAADRELHAAWESQNKEIDRLNADLIDYPHLQKVVDGQMAQNQRLRRIIEKLKAEQGNGNEPLTLEELKQMGGEPVWVVPKAHIHDVKPHYGLVIFVSGDDCVIYEADRECKGFKLHDADFYKHKPEGGEG